MERWRVDDAPQKKTYTQYFLEALPLYLSIGMTAKEFWEGDCCLAVAYRKADEMKRKDERDTKNFNAWLSGMYVSAAIASCFSKDFKYPEEPYKLFKEDEKKSLDEKMLELAEGFRQLANAKNKMKGQ